MPIYNLYLSGGTSTFAAGTNLATHIQTFGGSGLHNSFELNAVTSVVLKAGAGFTTDANVSDDRLGLGVRIVSNADGTILAASDSGGTYQIAIPLDIRAGSTTYTIASDLSFSYVNFSATKSQWCRAKIEYQQLYSNNMGGDGGSIASVQPTSLEVNVVNSTTPHYWYGIRDSSVVNTAGGMSGYATYYPGFGFEAGASPSLSMNNLFNCNITGKICFFEDHPELELWDVSTIVNMNSVFRGGNTNRWKGTADLSNWDTSSVYDLAYGFQQFTDGSLNLSGWNLTNLDTAAYCFYYCTQTANININGWVTSNKLKNIARMFEQSYVDANLNTWDFSGVLGHTSTSTGAYTAFRSNSVFNNGGVAPNWDMSSVTNTYGLFLGCTSLAVDMSGINLTNTATANNMFQSCSSFNAGLPQFGSALTNIGSLLYNASIFNHPSIITLDVSNVTNFVAVFLQASTFNQDISGWDVSNGVDFNSMLRLTPFNQNISGWNTSKATNMLTMLDSTPNFNQDLSGWPVPLIPTRPTGFSGMSTALEPVWGTWGDYPVLSGSVTGPGGYNSSGTIYNTTNKTAYGATEASRALSVGLSGFNVPGAVKGSKVIGSLPDDALIGPGGYTARGGIFNDPTYYSNSEYQVSTISNLPGSSHYWAGRTVPLIDDTTAVYATVDTSGFFRVGTVNIATNTYTAELSQSIGTYNASYATSWISSISPNGRWVVVFGSIDFANLRGSFWRYDRQTDTLDSDINALVVYTQSPAHSVTINNNGVCLFAATVTNAGQYVRVGSWNGPGTVNFVDVNPGASFSDYNYGASAILHTDNDNYIISGNERGSAISTNNGATYNDAAVQACSGRGWPVVITNGMILSRNVTDYVDSSYFASNGSLIYQTSNSAALTGTSTEKMVGFPYLVTGLNEVVMPYWDDTVPNTNFGNGGIRFATLTLSPGIGVTGTTTSNFGGVSQQFWTSTAWEGAKASRIRADGKYLFINIYGSTLTKLVWDSVADDDREGTVVTPITGAVTGPGGYTASGTLTNELAGNNITGSPQASRATSTAAGLLTRIVAGLAVSDTATSSANSEVIKTLSATSQASRATSTGAGVTNSASTIIVSGNPKAATATASGSVDLVWTVSGSPAADTATTTAVVEVVKTASGSPTAEAASSVGTLERVVTISASPQVGLATATGAGKFIWNASGTPQADTAVASGISELVNTASGIAFAQAATTAANVEVIRTAAATPQADRASALGIASRVITSIGSPQATTATVASDSARIVDAAGAPSSETATTSALAERVITGVAVSQAGSATSVATAEVTNKAVGVVQAATATAVSSATRIITVAGLAQANTATTESELENILSGSGGVTAQASSTAAQLEVIKTTAGSPQATTATATGTGTKSQAQENFVFLIGAPSAQDAQSTASATRVITITADLHMNAAATSADRDPRLVATSNVFYKEEQSLVSTDTLVSGLSLTETDYIITTCDVNHRAFLDIDTNNVYTVNTRL